MPSISALSIGNGALLALADAMPPPTSSRISRRSTARALFDQEARNEAHAAGQTPIHRVILNASVICSVFLIGIALGLRMRQKAESRRFRFTHLLVALQAYVAAAFALSVGILGPGFGIRTDHQCYIAIMICTVFYMLEKLVVYQILVERAHVIRSPFLDRVQDRIWVVFTILIASGPGVLTVVASVTPTHKFNFEKGTCAIGMNRYVSFIAHSLDLAINTALTGVFVWLLWPVIRVRIGIAGGGGVPGTASPNHMAPADSPAAKTIPPPNVASDPSQASRRESACAVLGRLGARTSSLAKKRKESRSKRSFVDSIQAMLVRNFLGSCAILASTATNVAVYFSWQEEQPAWMCLSFCLIDMSFCVLVVHWLAFGGSNEMPPPHAAPPSSASDPPHRPYCETDASLPELKPYEEMTIGRPDSSVSPQPIHGPEKGL